MNGGHDLGGKHGLGPIDPEPERLEPTFHAQWEERVFALTLAAGFLGEWNIDMSRHARERQHPADYLRNSYYENWLVGLETLLRERGLVDAAELHSGIANRQTAAKPGRVLRAPDVGATLAKGGPSAMDLPIEAKYQPGDPVRIIGDNPSGHTRVPGYARGKIGQIRVLHGVHVFADASAHGERIGEHLYTVTLQAGELWGKQADTSQRVNIDLWEPHLQGV